MKQCLMIVMAFCMFFSGVVPQASARKDMNMDELHQKSKDGDPAAQTQLGVAYIKGIGVDADQKEAAKWYRKAADQGYASGQWNLAFLYVRGVGVEEDHTEASKWFRLAADQGYPPAEYDLGMMYLQGLGVERSRSKALEWITKSADHGYKEASAFLTSRGIVKKEQEEEKD